MYHRQKGCDTLFVIVFIPVARGISGGTEGAVQRQICLSKVESRLSIISKFIVLSILAKSSSVYTKKFCRYANLLSYMKQFSNSREGKQFIEQPSLVSLADDTSRGGRTVIAVFNRSFCNKVMFKYYQVMFCFNSRSITP